VTVAFRNIVVAVRDIGAATGLLSKAGALSARGARIELLHVLTGPVSVAISGLRQPRDALAQATREAAERVHDELQRLATARAPETRNVSVHVSRNLPIADAIVRRAGDVGADLLVAAVQPPRFAGRLLLVNTDWELIREATCPVLIVKRGARYRAGAVLAAVDPFHANDKPARLDARLIATARSVARSLGGEAHVLHAYAPLAAIMPASLMQPLPVVVSAKDDAAYTRQVRRTFDALAARAGIPPARRHLRPGDVTAQLTRAVRETGAQLVVMGAISRSGMKRVFIGNTAERVLDRLQCDLLVVKPTGGKGRIPSRRS
jgi:universal stress protein E